MWTKLLHVNIGKAIKPQIVDGARHRAVISARYKAMLKKQYRIAGVPWIYESNVSTAVNPRHKKPKGHKHEFKMPIHLAKVKQALESSEEAMEKYRKERLQGRRLTGLNRLIKNTIPPYLKQLARGFSRAESTDAGDDDILGVKRLPKNKR